ncbi:MAG: GIY-YIG nuclease family protein [Rickettsiales bacterium]|jgi:putative endonuclease|nr:GIY-YIG nuclease family protein [Rickettsiales bacterium]
MLQQQLSSMYIICSKRNGTLYTGCTNNLIRRIYEHKNKLADGFTRKYNIDKLALIEGSNPAWKDLYYEIV